MAYKHTIDFEPSIVVLSKEGCYWCEKLELFFKENEIDYKKLLLNKDFSRLYFEIEYPFYNEFPVIKVDGKNHNYASFMTCWNEGFFQNGYFRREPQIKMTLNDTRMLSIDEYNELMVERQDLIKKDFRYCVEAGENAKIPKHNSKDFMSKKFGV